MDKERCNPAPALCQQRKGCSAEAAESKAAWLLNPNALGHTSPPMKRTHQGWVHPCLPLTWGFPALELSLALEKLRMAGVPGDSSYPRENISVQYSSFPSPGSEVFEMNSPLFLRKSIRTEPQWLSVLTVHYGFLSGFLPSQSPAFVSCLGFLTLPPQ